MASPEHVQLVWEGLKAWSRWRDGNRRLRPDLRGADLRGINLRGADLRDADLCASNLIGADLRGADLRAAHVGEANLHGANLHGANLHEATLVRTDLRDANLVAANLRRADLREADLSRADLRDVEFIEADLSRSKFSGAILFGTTFGSANLMGAQGLDQCRHFGPSMIDHHTLQLSWPLPPTFLRGFGLSDWQIEEAKLLDPTLTPSQISDIQYRVFDLRAGKPLQIHNLFISYSHADSAFIDRLERHLFEKGIRFWRDVHHASSGRLEKVVEHAMRLHPTVLLVLSKAAVESDWVEHEVRLARKLEKETGRDVLCPVALDDAWKSSRWPERLQEQIEEYHILDLSCWQDPKAFKLVFNRLVEGLDLFYKGGAERT